MYWGKMRFWSDFEKSEGEEEERIDCIKRNCMGGKRSTKGSTKGRKES